MTDIIETALLNLAHAVANTLEAILGAPRLDSTMMIDPRTMVEKARMGATTIHL
ncbi:MAG: hypothetical protein ACJAYE_001301 [Candidatus Azotimanducaceae bacterium]|jgi:hypothetical protein